MRCRRVNAKKMFINVDLNNIILQFGQTCSCPQTCFGLTVSYDYLHLKLCILSNFVQPNVLMFLFQLRQKLFLICKKLTCLTLFWTEKEANLSSLLIFYNYFSRFVSNLPFLCKIYFSSLSKNFKLF